jgi:hypothetical protein
MKRQFPKHEFDKLFKKKFAEHYGDNALAYIKIGWDAAAEIMFDKMNT